MRRALLLAALGLPGGAVALAAQGLSLSAAAVQGSDLHSRIAFGYDARPLGPARVTLDAHHLGATDGDRWGAGFEMALRLGATARLYPVAGVAGGWGTGRAEGTWGGWSGGLGYELLRGGRFVLSVEGRYLRLSNPGDAVSVGIRIGYRVGSTARGAATASAVAPAGFPPAVMAAVVQSAVEVMGSPYLWGGNDGNGFDCSGLIQYAYGRHGIALPRVSREQALVGSEVGRDTLNLNPGDILTFSDAGGRVTHVGLFIGDGRFIHSSNRGVVVSRLGPDDPDGAYWWRRWLGARRVQSGG